MMFYGPSCKVKLLLDVRNLVDHSKFLDNIRIKVGNGNSISFWKVEWFGKPCLAMLFPTIFRGLINKEE